jgi:hypothetical protein
VDARAGEFIGHREAARRYGVSVPTIRRRVQRGQLETFVLPLDDRKKLIRVRDLEALMRPQPVRSREVAPTAA